MKKILIIFIILLIGCTKYEESDVTVGFNVTLVGNPITKVSDSEIYSVLQQCMPTVYPLSIKNLNTNRRYNCNSNEVINLPYGEYEIQLGKDYTQPAFYNGSWYYGEWISAECNSTDNSVIPGQGTSGASRFFSGPSISLKDTVVISSNNIINLYSKLTCSALIWNNSEIDSISFANKVKRCFGNICVCFFQIREERFPLYFTLIPKSGYDLIETYYSINKSEITYGYWYFVKCNSSERSDYTTNINSQNWNKGEL